MTLDAWLAWKQMSATEFGRLLPSLKSPHNARRYLRRNLDGSRSADFRRPEWPVMLQILKATDKAVMPNDWI